MSAEAAGEASKTADPRAETVAIFGGSFNPPHVGHALLAAYVHAIEDVDRILVVPVYSHVFSKGLAPFEDRLRMCELAFAHVRNISISTLERDLGGESRTLRTLEQLHAAHPSWKMRLVIGSDVLGETDKWHRFDLVSALAPPIVVPRAGHSPPGQAALPEVSSSEVRKHFASSDWAGLSTMVPRSVIAYARGHGLYT